MKIHCIRTGLTLSPLFLGAALSLAGITPASAQVPGGFVEQPLTAVARAPLTSAQVQAFLPARGAFTFPAPYNTRGVRLTNATDCNGGDCVWAVGYSYWRNINNHVGSNVLYAFIGLNQNLGGGGPTLFSYDKTTDEVRNLGALFAPGTGFASRSGEGWYFSGTQPTTMYLDDGPRMLRFDVLTRQSQTVFDVRAQFGADRTIWQMHSSDDDTVHSATLRSGTGAMLGCVVYREPAARFDFFPTLGSFNECMVDKSGRYVTLIDNVDQQYDDEMRVIDLGTGVERMVYDQNGAIGHYDMGYGYAIGTDNWSNKSNAYKTWDYGAATLAGLLVSWNNDWSAAGPNHISHTNARPGVPASEQYACGSSAAPNAAVWGNEVVCFRMDGLTNVAVIAPVMTNMNAASGGDSYNKQPKGNLDVTGQYFIWTSNTGGSRVDAFIVKVPAQLMGVSTDPIPVPPPPPPPLPPPDLTPPVITGVTSSNLSTSGATIAWTTDELGDSQVEYGLTTAYGSASALNPNQALTHAETLSGLAAGSVYHYRVKSRDAAGNLGVSADATFTTASAPVPPPSPPPPAGSQPVTWTHLANVTATGNSLTKTSGCDGCADAGAVSSQKITSGDGYLEFTVTETNYVRWIGLSNGTLGTGTSTIRFGFKLVSGTAEVREKGTYRSDVAVVTGDVLRIAVQSGRVKYSKNGTVFYTSVLAPIYPLRVDSALTSLGATLGNVVIGAGKSASLATSEAEAATAPPAGGGGGAFDLRMLALLLAWLARASVPRRAGAAVRTR